MRRNQLWENGVTAIFVCCAVIVTTLVVRRELFSNTAPPVRAVAVGLSVSAPRLLERWRDLSRDGVRFGTPNAPVTLVEFSDFQCPFCSKMHFVLRQFMDRHPGRLTVVYRHFPIEEAHPFALAAAIAFECADAQHQADAFERVVFEHQDSIGHWTWEHYASIARVPDTTALRSCRSAQWPLDRIKRDGQVAQDIGVLGTPTLILGDELVAGTMPIDSLEHWIDRYTTSHHSE